MNAIETITRNGLTIRICADEQPENPRDWDNAGKMVCWHRRYKLGDKHDFETPGDFDEWWQELGLDDLCLPLFLYDHSGITMRCSQFPCPWDSGQVGWIYATTETIRKEWNGA